MEQQIKERKKKLTIDLWIIALVTIAVYIVYGVFGSRIMSFCKNSDISVWPRLLMAAALEFGIAGLGITFVKDNIIRYQQNLNIGVIRVKESFNRNQRSSMKFNQALAEYLSSTMGAVRDALKNEQIHYLVLTGAESELLLQMMGVEFKAGVIRIKTEQFMQLFKTVHELNLPQIIKVFKINEDVAELVVPTILLYEQLLALVPVQEIILTDDRFIDGICLLHIGPKASKDYADELEQEQLSLLYSIGERYQYDEAHSRQVAKLALAMFDKLGKHHGLDSHSRILLQATAQLHDIGKNLVKMMLEGKGLTVVDLGVDVPAEKFVAAAVENNAQLICCSALLTTTMGEMKSVVEEADKQGIRDKVKILVGGAPVSQSFCVSIGADGYTADAASCADMALSFCQA